MWIDTIINHQAAPKVLAKQVVKGEDTVMSFATLPVQEVVEEEIRTKFSDRFPPQNSFRRATKEACLP